MGQVQRSLESCHGLLAYYRQHGLLSKVCPSVGPALVLCPQPTGASAVHGHATAAHLLLASGGVCCSGIALCDSCFTNLASSELEEALLRMQQHLLAIGMAQ
jgi:hypothetical protein